VNEKKYNPKLKKWCIDCWATGKVDWIDYAKGIRRPMPSIYDHLFRLTDRSSDQQLDVIKKITMEICSDTDVECPTCEGKGYIGYFNWDPSKKLILCEDYIDELGYKMVEVNEGVILTEKIEFSFENFIDWLSEEFERPRLITSLGGRVYFHASMVYAAGNKCLQINYGNKGNTGLMTLDQIKVVWDRYINLGNRKHVTGEYTDPLFQKTPNRILAPYVAALIRDFENTIYDIW